MKKRLFCLILSLLLVVGLLPLGLRANAAESMGMSQKGIDLLKEFEGFSRMPYWDYSQYTVGYGTRCPDEDLDRYLRDGITEAEAEALLRTYTDAIGRALNNFTASYGITLTQNQFDALAMFSFNCGTGWLYEEGQLRSAVLNGATGNSLIHPLTILSTLPPAGGGALIALMLCGKEFSVIALIGVLLLCGLVKKNAILVIDFALTAERMEHKTSLEAISEACRLRFRPIMMTTFAAMFGAVPLALGQGDGAELRQPLGIAIVGGLAVSQLLTLYTTPVIFLWLDGISKRFSGALLRRRYGARRAGLILAIREGMKA